MLPMLALKAGRCPVPALDTDQIRRRLELLGLDMTNCSDDELELAAIHVRKALGFLGVTDQQDQPRVLVAVAYAIRP